MTVLSSELMFGNSRYFVSDPQVFETPTLVFSYVRLALVMSDYLSCFFGINRDISFTKLASKLMLIVSRVKRSGHERLCPLNSLKTSLLQVLAWPHGHSLTFTWSL